MRHRRAESIRIYSPALLLWVGWRSASVQYLTSPAPSQPDNRRRGGRHPQLSEYRANVGCGKMNGNSKCCSLLKCHSCLRTSKLRCWLLTNNTRPAYIGSCGLSKLTTYLLTQQLTYFLWVCAESAPRVWAQSLCWESTIGPAFLRHLSRFECFNPPWPCLNVKMKESARKSPNPPWLAIAISL